MFFVKKVLPTWGMQEVEMANGIGDAEGMEMEMDMKQGEGMESAVACEAVEFEDLFANPIEQGSNLEFRVSRVSVGGSEVMDLGGVVCEGGEGEIGIGNEVSEVYAVECGENLVKEELSEIEVKVEPPAIDVKEVKNEIGSSEGASEEIKLEEEIDSSVIMNRLELQTKLVNSHVEELKRIAILQYRLTGINPLAQELASTVLGTEEGWRTGLGLSSETLRYLHAVFAVKDTLTKKEACDVGIVSGATLSQVREFFSTQRSRVRALVQQYTDEAEARSVEIGEERSNHTPDFPIENDIGFTNLTDLDSVELLLVTMRQEKRFSQQEQLLLIILRTEPGLILRRFLEKGGLKVLCAWLINAAAGEQTSVLRQLLNVLSHLPMSCAIPLQVSALLQPVNKLRFYFVQDVANHARILMSKWSKLFMNKVENGLADSAGLGSTEREKADALRRVKKRVRDAGATMKSVEGGAGKNNAAELVKSQLDLAQVSVKAHSSGEGKFSSGLTHGAARSAGGKILNSKLNMKPKNVVKEVLNYNTSMMKALSGMQSNIKKSVPRKETLQPQNAMKPCVSNTSVADEIAVNQAPGGEAQIPISGSSSSSQSNSSQVTKARVTSMTDEDPKTAAKAAIVTSNVRGFSNIPVSETANIATPVSRRRPLADQQKERRKVLPVDDSGNGNRWRESTTRRPVIEVGKTSRPLSADEIRKAKLRARIMQQPSSGFSGNKQLNAPDQIGSRGKPKPVGDGWSLDRYASMQVMDGSGKSSQICSGVSLVRPTSFNADTASAPRLILDDKTFDELLTEQARENDARKLEHTSCTQKKRNHVDSLEEGIEVTGNYQEINLPEGGSDPCVCTYSEMANKVDSGDQPTSITVDREPRSPSIVDALRGDSVDLVSDVVEDFDVRSDSVKTSPEDLTTDVAAEGLLEATPMETNLRPASASEVVNAKSVEPRVLPWVVPPVLNLNPTWGVVAGDTSKEQGVQAARVKREEEVVYSDLLFVPDNPRDLWDEEPVYDDTLTPEIPVEVSEISSSKPSSPNNAVAVKDAGSNPLTDGTASAGEISGGPSIANTNTFAAAQQLGDAASGHDPNLLALLLSNPALVSQLALQQKEGGSLAGLSALLGLGKMEDLARSADPTHAGGVLSHPTNISNLLGVPQLQDQVPAMTDFKGCQPLSTSGVVSFPETNSEPVRTAEDKLGAVVTVPNWEVPSWAQPSPPPAPMIGLIPHSQGSSNVPLPHIGSVPQDFSSLGPPSASTAYNGSFQKLPNVPYTWAPSNTQVMHTTANQFDSSVGRGRVPVLSHIVNGASGMPNVVNDATVSSGVQPPVFGQVAQFNSVGWPPHGSRPSTVVHRNVSSHPVNSSIRGNVSSWTPHSSTTHGYPDVHRRLPEPPPLWGRNPMPATQSVPAPPPPYSSHPSSNQYWQQQDPSFRPPPSSHPAHYTRPHHPPAWHQNGSNYGPNR